MSGRHPPPVTSSADHPPLKGRKRRSRVDDGKNGDDDHNPTDSDFAAPKEPGLLPTIETSLTDARGLPRRDPPLATSVETVVPPLTWKALRIEAIFHPKFDNEKSPPPMNAGGGPAEEEDDHRLAPSSTTTTAATDEEGEDEEQEATTRTIRQQMLHRLALAASLSASLGPTVTTPGPAAAAAGYWEVSLKHSGSLLLWSGGARFYSKNATDNRFTAVGEILLRQHLTRAFFFNDQQEKEALRTMVRPEETQYQQCSQFIQQHRLTLAFEVVTSFLGDHGARPRRDFLILHAVAQRHASSSSSSFWAPPTFWSTAQVIQLAQQFRLPHNDVWIYPTLPAAQALLAWYDGAGRETATAPIVLAQLTQTAPLYIPSMYPHEVFQGDIMEGLVIRMVYYDDHDHQHHQQHLAMIQQQAQVAREIRQNLVPPNRPSCPELWREYTASKSLDESSMAPPVNNAVLSTDLRLLVARVTDGGRAPDGDALLEEQLRSILQSSHKSTPRRTVTKVPLVAHIPTATQHLTKEGADPESRAVAHLLHTLDALHKRVEYVLMQEHHGIVPHQTRWICIIHVFHDETFAKFRSRAQPGDLPLYRGFAIELVPPDQESDSSIARNDAGSSVDQMQDDLPTPEPVPPASEDDRPLMIKMKLLPYMIRTFCCRNGLRVLRNNAGNVEAFVRFTDGLLAKWKMSTAARERWQPFLRAWGYYASACMLGSPPTEEARSLPELQDSRYLDHLELFENLYESGHFADVLSNKTTSNLRGLIVVVAMDQGTSQRVADFVAVQLGGIHRNDTLQDIRKENMEGLCIRGHACVASEILSKGFGGLRKLAAQFSQFISIIMFGCDETIAGMVEGDEKKKLLGVAKGWTKTRCANLFQLSTSSLFMDDDMDTEEGKEFHPSSEFNETIQKLKDSHSVDEGTGLLVFFPGIPGSGKSSVVAASESELASKLAEGDERIKRKLLVLVGDQMAQKFWPTAKLSMLADPATIMIADKNAPPSAWNTIGALCSATNALSVPVLPDTSALSTTAVEGIRDKEGTVLGDSRHIYPFSLDYLAVCISRVLARPRGSHAGKLDHGTEMAALITVKFFSFYRGIAADQLLPYVESTIYAAGGHTTGKAFTLPFFRHEETTNMLSSLEAVLTEALQYQYGCDKDNVDIAKVEGPYGLDLEARVRRAVEEDRPRLKKLVETESVSQRRFVDELWDQVCRLPMSSTGKRAPFIKIVSVDVGVQRVHELLLSLTNLASCRSFFEQTCPGRPPQEVFRGADTSLESKEVIAKTHVTMAHFQDLTQADMRREFDRLQGARVDVIFTALWWSARVAALEVCVARTTQGGEAVPAAINTFPHVTIWMAEGVKAVESNQLPAWLNSGEATRVDLPQRVSVEGVLSFWYEDTPPPLASSSGTSVATVNIGKA